MVSDAAKRLSPFRDRIARGWSERFATAGVPSEELSGARIDTFVRRSVDALFDHLPDGDVAGFLGAVQSLGGEYAEAGVSYETLVLSVHLYEEVVLPLLAKEYQSRGEFVRVLMAFDRLYHHFLAELASAYWGNVTKRLEERTRLLTTLYDLLSGAATLDLDMLLRTTLDRLIDTLGLDYGEVFILDKKTELLVSRASLGLPDEFAHQVSGFPLGHGVPGIVAQSKELLVIPDLRQDERFVRTVPSELGIRGVLAAPLASPRRVVGVLVVYGQEVLPANREMLELVRAACSELGVVVENALLYEEVQERARQMETVSREREQFVAMVAHDTRGPLAVIMGSAQLLAANLKRGRPPLPATIDAIISQSQLLNRLITDLEEVSLIQTGRFSVVTEEGVDLAQVVNDVVGAQRLIVPEREFLVDCNRERIVGRFDRGRIAQALGNLISNAVKFSSEGSTIRVILTAIGSRVVIAVQDQGIGIDPQDLPRLFRPYTKLYRDLPIKGSGLGLYITKGIAEAHGGAISVDSKKGVGSTFSLELPLEGE